MYFSLSHYLTCFCLIFHLRNKKNIMIWLSSTFVTVPYYGFFPPDILRSSSDLSQRAWIPLNMFLHSDLFLPPSLPLSLYPSLLFSLSSNICSSQIWWRNLIRAERETRRNEGQNEERKQSNNEWSVTPRADKAKISVFKSDLVDLKERGILNLVTTLDETIYRCSSALTLQHCFTYKWNCR